MILETLLETGEYRKSRSGKSDFVQFTCTANSVDNNVTIDINVPPDHPNTKQALLVLNKELASKWQLKNKHHFIIADNKLTITKEGYQELQIQAVIGSALEVVLRPVKLILDLAETNSDKLDNTLSAILANKNTFICIASAIINIQAQPYKKCSVNRRIAPRIAKQIANSLTAAIKRRYSAPMMVITPKNIDLTINHFEAVNEQPNKPEIIIAIPESTYNSMQKMYSTGSSSIDLPRLNPVVQSLPTNSYADIAGNFLIIQSSFLQDKRRLLEGYANLITQQADKVKYLYKKICFKFITELFRDIKDLAEIADLFDHLLTFQSQIDIHRNPKIDFMFFKRNTTSWQDMISDIRNDAFLKLTAEYNEKKSSSLDAEEPVNLLKTFRDRKLFTEHRGNGLKRIGKTSAVKDIDDMLLHEHKRKKSVKLHTIYE